MDKFIRSCEWCLVEFETEWDTKKYCCRSHKEAARQYRKSGTYKGDPTLRTATPVFPKVCVSCEEVFVTTRTAKVYCSNDCAKLARQRRIAESGRERRQKKSPSLKARIYFRDSGLCQLCFGRIDTEVKYPDPWSLSLDHILPVSQGGTDAAYNLRATHLVCNVRRGDATLPPSRAYANHLEDTNTQ